MKPLIASLVAIIIVLAIGLGYFLYQSLNSPVETPITINPTPIPATAAPTSTPTASTSLFCSPSELQTTAQSEGAAGSVYLTVNIKNSGNRSCQIVGNKFIKATSTAQNIVVKEQGQPTTVLLTIAPGQTVYSQIRYQNGPQCSGPTTETPISYSYPISPTDSLAITDSSNPLTIGVCSSPSENTTVDVWSLSLQPLNQ